MTVDETIKWFEQNMPEWVNEAELYGAVGCYGSGKLVCNEPEGYVYKAAIELLEELKWYREQKPYQKGKCD